MERKRAGKKDNDEFKKTIVDLYHAGNSVKDLSSEYAYQFRRRLSNTERSSYYHFVQKDGIKPRIEKSEADERNPTNSCEK